jgi:hypothetical protein
MITGESLTTWTWYLMNLSFTPDEALDFVIACKEIYERHDDGELYDDDFPGYLADFVATWMDKHESSRIVACRLPGNEFFGHLDNEKDTPRLREPDGTL